MKKIKPTVIFFFAARDLKQTYILFWPLSFTSPPQSSIYCRLIKLKSNCRLDSHARPPSSASRGLAGTCQSILK